jgi:hypothetical protein
MIYERWIKKAKFQASAEKEIWTAPLLDSCPLKMGPIGCPETSLRNYHHTLRNSSEERTSRIKKGWDGSGRGLIKVLYRNFPEGTEANQDKLLYY